MFNTTRNNTPPNAENAVIAELLSKKTCPKKYSTEITIAAKTARNIIDVVSFLNIISTSSCLTQQASSVFTEPD